MTTPEPAVLDLHQHLPPYSSLLDPTTKYDYVTHSLIPLNERRVFEFTPPLKTVVNKEKLKMRYKSLLSDVSRTKSILSLKLSSLVQQLHAASKSSAPHHLNIINLPFELTAMIVDYVDDHESYLSLLRVNRLFYKLTKPLVYETLIFKSSYRLAQFVTLLRIDHSVGYFVRRIDLSQLQSNAERLAAIEEAEAQVEIIRAEAGVQEANTPAEVTVAVNPPGMNSVAAAVPDENRYLLSVAVDEFQDWAGWREWKYHKNPLYRPVVPLGRILSHSISARTAGSLGRSSLHSSRSLSASLHSFFSINQHRLGLKRLFKRHNSHSVGTRAVTRGQRAQPLRPLEIPRRPLVIPRLLPVSETLDLSLDRASRSTRSLAHPLASNVLEEYVGTKDIPLGTLLHLIHLCPNLEYLNLSKVVLSQDYEVEEGAKFQCYDVGSTNYPKDMCVLTTKIMRQSLEALTMPPPDAAGMGLHLAASVRWSPSETYLDGDYASFTHITDLESLSSFAAPSRGYNKLYLSDLNLKSINPTSLTPVSQNEILQAIKECCFRLRMLELQSLTWLNRQRLAKLVGLPSLLSLPDLRYLNLTNAGMSKRLNWAKALTVAQLRYVLLDEENSTDDMEEPDDNNFLAVRRGRVGETYI